MSRVYKVCVGCVCSPSSPPGLPLGCCQGRGRQGVPGAAPCFGNVRGSKGGVQQQDQGMCLWCWWSWQHPAPGRETVPGGERVFSATSIAHRIASGVSPCSSQHFCHAALGTCKAFIPALPMAPRPLRTEGGRRRTRVLFGTGVSYLWKTELIGRTGCGKVAEGCGQEECGVA